MRNSQFELLDAKSVERRILSEQYYKSLGSLSDCLCNGQFPDLPPIPLNVDDLCLKLHLRRNIEKATKSQSEREFSLHLMKCRVIQRLLGINYDPSILIPEYLSLSRPASASLKSCPVCGNFVSNMDDHVLICIASVTSNATHQDSVSSSSSSSSSISRKRSAPRRHDFSDDWDDDYFNDRISALDQDAPLIPIRVFVNEAEEGMLDSTVFENLHNFQRDGIKWLYGLYLKRTGGILADDMGLGKTAQTAAHINMIRQTNLHAKLKCLIICPATVLEFWVRELHNWCPRARVVLFHSISRKFSSIPKDDLLDEFQTIVDSSSLLIVLTTYEGLIRNESILQTREWSVCVLDEGHKIRNPISNISIACRSIPCEHRIILTGTPIQNSLTELWSLMDFASSGRLGTIDSFDVNFVRPIRYAGMKASSRQQTAFGIKCAQALKDLISPYFLRRLKECVDVGRNLPPKTEHILYCRLTPVQRQLYVEALGSNVVLRAMNSKNKPFQAISLLRHICNHSSIVLDRQGKHKWEVDDDDDVSESARGIDGSGKMIVLNKLLSEWNGKHKLLLFSQTKLMLDIVERLFVSKEWTYLRMDGGTAISQRDTLVEQFNNEELIFAFLLTTRTGGLGISLTGADRVIILDPDWNPQTDIQARERAWRIGQTKPVCIYRLICKGTIEEKIYHRQIFKILITNRVLKDPKQTSLFKYNSLREFFQLDDDEHDDDNCDFVASTSYDNDDVGLVDDENDGRTKSDQDVLRSLTSNSMLSGLGDHESLLSFNGSDGSIDSRAIEQEIQHAMSEIKRSSRMESMAINGLSSSSSSSSSSLLSEIRTRNLRTCVSEHKEHRSFQHLSVIRTLNQFLSQGPKTTEEILQQFDTIPDSYAPYFRHAINCIADNDNGRWVLK